MYGANHDTVLSRTAIILDICRKLNIDTVAGPAMSGVVIASMCFMRSMGDVNAILLGKDGFKRSKHEAFPKILIGQDIGILNRIMIVDDCIESGDTIIHAINEIEEFFSNITIIAIYSDGGFYWNEDVILRMRRRILGVRFFTQNSFTYIEVG